MSFSDTAVLNAVRKCLKCGELKELKNFHRDKKSKDGYSTQCSTCRNALTRIYKQKNPEKYKKLNRDWQQRSPKNIKNAHLKHSYKLTLDQFNEMLKKQNNGCAVCGKINENGYSLYVDHDHSCCPTEKSCGKCVRGLLCNNCNLAIGFLKENVNIFTRCIDYLSKRN